MTATTNILLRQNYPKVPGDQPWSMIDVRGPATYDPLVPGEPPTGGQRITARDFGLQFLEFVVAMGSNDGGYCVVVIPDHFALQSDMDAVLLQWLDNPAGTESSGDLSGSIVRLLAIGR
jgi:hypothetical protein